MVNIPTNCPSCSSLLELVNDQLYCRNTNCPAKSSKKLEHFAKTLKIKGLGPASIDKLGLTYIEEIYELDITYASLALGSEKLAIKLLEEIDKSKTAKLNTLLPAFGIPLIGTSATDKLAIVCSSIEDISEETCKKAGLGPVAIKNILEWLEHDLNLFLPFDFKFDTIKTIKEVVCITGKLKSFKTKDQAKKALEERGYKVKDTITKEVTVLVNESNEISSKSRKAEELGIKIVTNINELIGE